jgi:hypothetical protein
MPVELALESVAEADGGSALASCVPKIEMIEPGPGGGASSVASKLAPFTSPLIAGA